MIRNLLATTAIATLVASGAMAQTTAPTTDPSAPAAGQQQEPMTIHADGHLASNVIGETVYNGTGEQAENIGDVTDVVLSDDGQVQALVVGVGGFLGIGQKEVALEYDIAEWSEQQDGERWLIVETTRDALEALPEFDRSAYRPMPMDADVSQTKPATKDDLAAAPQQQGEQADDQTATAPLEGPSDEAGDTAAAVPEGQDTTDQTAGMPEDQQETGDTAAVTETQDQPAQTEDRVAAQTDQATEADQTQTGAIDRSNLQEAQPDQIRAEDLTGATVYGANEEEVGSVGDVILTPEGDVDAVIVDVGGFLGVGQKEVAIGIDNVAFMTDQGDDLYLYTEFSQEELEAQPEYDEAAYAEQRDEMRMQ